MEHKHNDAGISGRQGTNGKTVGRWVFIGFLLVAGYFVITEHRAHLFGVLPFLLLAACPLMHLFHHGGHGGAHHHHDRDDAGGTAPDEERNPTSRLDR